MKYWMAVKGELIEHDAHLDPVETQLKGEDVYLLPVDASFDQESMRVLAQQQSDELARQRAEQDEREQAAAQAVANQPTMLAKVARIKRDSLLLQTDWQVTRHLEEVELGAALSMSDDAYVALLKYRQALREVPKQGGFPQAIDWPVL